MTTRNPSNNTVEEATDHGRHARVFRAARCVSPVRAAGLHDTKPVRSQTRAVRAAVWAIVGAADRRMPGAATPRGSARRGDWAARPALAIRGRASDAGADGTWAIRFHRSAGSVRLAYRAVDRRMGGISTAQRLSGTGTVWISSGMVWVSPGIVRIPSRFVRAASGIVWISSGSVRYPSRPGRPSVRRPVLATVRDQRRVARPASRLRRWSAGRLSYSRGTAAGGDLGLAAADRESAPRRGGA